MRTDSPLRHTDRTSLSKEYPPCTLESWCRHQPQIHWCETQKVEESGKGANTRCFDHCVIIIVILRDKHYILCCLVQRLNDKSLMFSFGKQLRERGAVLTKGCRSRRPPAPFRHWCHPWKHDCIICCLVQRRNDQSLMCFVEKQRRERSAVLTKGCRSQRPPAPCRR